jgi:hypothetical protein
MRRSCVICNESTFLVYLDSVPSVPLFMGTTTESEDTDLYMDQDWCICKICGCIQLGFLVNPDTLYTRGHAPGTVGAEWTRHHVEFAKFVNQYTRGKLLEVGAGTDLLARLINHERAVESYVIVDPNVRLQSKMETLKVIPKLFTPAFSDTIGEIDTVIHSHTMEHLYNPLDDLRRMVHLLPDGGWMIISVPVISNFLERGFTNGLNFEHTYLTTELNIEYLLNSAGLKTYEKYWFNDLNVFIAARKTSQFNHPILVNESEAAAELWTEYTNSLKTDVSILNGKLRETWKPTFIFGAHVFTQTLLSYGLNFNFEGILDNADSKVGQRLYGTSLTVYHPSKLQEFLSPRVILRAAQYTEEITTQLKELNPHVEII